MSVNIKDNTAEVLKEVDRLSDKAFQEVAPFVVASAQEFVPVVSGDLQGSIVAEVEDGTLRIGSPLDYADEIEVGTEKTPAQPYLRPALMKTLRRFERAFRS